MRKQIGKIQNPSEAKRARRRLSIRKKINGTVERPRLCAVRTNKHLSVQVVDDTAGKTLLVVQSYGKNAVANAGDNKEGAKLIGAEVATQLKKHNIVTAVFDRAGRQYTGVLQTLVESIRENGIQI